MKLRPWEMYGLLNAMLLLMVANALYPRPAAVWLSLFGCVYMGLWAAWRLMTRRGRS